MKTKAKVVATLRQRASWRSVTLLGLFGREVAGYEQNGSGSCGTCSAGGDYDTTGSSLAVAAHRAFAAGSTTGPKAVHRHRDTCTDVEQSIDKSDQLRGWRGL
ncbi:hypothetical protein J6590_087328 [Homalodisca vitripennis]|nr:hypothetical protein J6590_087328 [Homalodisca vitripennis]